MGKNDISALANRIYQLDPYGFKNSTDDPDEAIKAIIKELRTYKGAINCIDYLLSYIEEADT